MERGRLFELDGLRAIAIVLVVFFHLRLPGFSAGYLGVDLFFILSGFLMTYTMLREREAQGTFRILAFYGRRFRRLVPSLAIVLAGVLALGWMLMSPTHLRDLAAQAIRAMTFTSNHYFFEQAGYFDLSNEVRPLLHTWSLSVEEQFYLFFGVLLFLGNRVSFRFVVSVGFAFALVGACFILVNRELSNEIRVTLPFVPPEKYETAMFYLLPQRLFQFMTGVMLGLSIRRQKTFLQGPIAAFALMIPVAAFIGAQAFLGPEYSAFIMTGFAVLLFLPNVFLERFGQAAPVQYLAKISYQLYLTHWPVIVFWRYVTGEALGVWGGICVLILSFVSAWGIYKLTQVKGQRLARRIGVFAGAPIIAASAIVGAMLADGAVWRVPADRVYPTAKEMRAAESAYCYGSHLDENGKELTAGRPDIPLVTCENRRDGNPIIYVLGDSHARHLLAGLSEVYPEHQISILYYSSCLAQSGLADYRYDYDGKKGKEDGCVARNLAALEFFATAEPATILIHQYAGYNGDNSEAWYGAADVLVKKLKAMPHAVAWIGSVVYPGTAMSECLNVPKTISNAQLARRCKGDPEVSQAIYDKNEALEAYFPDVYINPNDFFCTGESATDCAVFKNGALIFRDQHHLTVGGSQMLIDYLGVRLRDVAGLEDPQ